MVAFRNILIDGYPEVNRRIVKVIVSSKLPTLREEMGRLASEPD
ncbi:MAG: HepT-like ribonuclease domain-containing protein [Thermoanaerobaculaceae bacterium]